MTLPLSSWSICSTWMDPPHKTTKKIHLFLYLCPPLQLLEAALTPSCVHVTPQPKVCSIFPRAPLSRDLPSALRRIRSSRTGHCRRSYYQVSFEWKLQPRYVSQLILNSKKIGWVRQNARLKKYNHVVTKWRQSLHGKGNWPVPVGRSKNLRDFE